MSEYKPGPSDWVAKQVELYESSGGTEGTTLRDTGLPVIIVTNRGNKTGAIRKTPLMRAVDGTNYILVASKGGAPEHPLWYNNLKADPNVTIQDETEVYQMRVREVEAGDERDKLWTIAVEAYPALPRLSREDRPPLIPVFIAEVYRISMSHDKRRFIIVGTGRSGSSLLAAILAGAGADFAMPSKQQWGRDGGGFEHPDFVRAYNWYERANILKTLPVPISLD